MRRFGGRPDALGSTATFGERTFTIVGVMPLGFRFPTRTDVWYPAWVQPETASRSAHNYRVVARLKDSVALVEAQAEMTALAARLEQTYPASNDGKGVVIVPLQEQLVGDTRPTLNLLAGAVGLVLLIACANVANLLLARAIRAQGGAGAPCGAGRPPGCRASAKWASTGASSSLRSRSRSRRASCSVWRRRFRPRASI